MYATSYKPLSWREKQHCHSKYAERWTYYYVRVFVSRLVVSGRKWEKDWIWWNALNWNEIPNIGLICRTQSNQIKEGNQGNWIQSQSKQSVYHLTTTTIAWQQYVSHINGGIFMCTDNIRIRQIFWLLLYGFLFHGCCCCCCCGWFV